MMMKSCLQVSNSSTQLLAVFNPYVSTRGTMIDTADGPVAVEDLGSGPNGAHVNGMQAVRWIGQKPWMPWVILYQWQRNTVICIPPPPYLSGWQLEMLFDHDCIGDRRGIGERQHNPA